MRSPSETNKHYENHNRGLNSCLSKRQNSSSVRRVSFYPRNQVIYIEKDLRYCDREYLEAADLILKASKRTSKRRGNYLVLLLKRVICDWTNESDHLIHESKLNSFLLETFKDAFYDRLDKLPLYVESSESEAEFITRKMFQVVQINGWPEVKSYVSNRDLNSITKQTYFGLILLL